MPLFTSSDPADAQSVITDSAEYLVFYSSVDATNQMWCPDCRRVEGLVRKTFEPATASSALIVFVGQRENWKENAANPFRGSPWKITSVPTILRRDGARLADDEISDASLASFVKLAHN